MAHRFTVIVVAILLLCGTSATQADPLSHSLFLLQSAMLQLLDAADDNPESFDPKINRDLRDSVNRLQALAANGVESNAAQSYSKGLAYDAILLARAASGSSREEKIGIITDVTSDIKLKIAFPLGAMNANPTLRDLVDVSAVTKQGGMVLVNGYLIGCNPKRYAGSDPMYTFNKPSSPTTTKLPPGRYECIATKLGQVAARQTVEIGLIGDLTTEFVLSVP